MDFIFRIWLRRSDFAWSIYLYVFEVEENKVGMYIRDWFSRWLLEYDDRKKYKGLPRGCWNCEVLGLCRKPKEEGWECYNGCMLINSKFEREYEGLPKGCWRCRYLTECRRPKEEGWKCYNGCRVIKEKEEKERKLLEKQEKKNKRKQKKSK